MTNLKSFNPDEIDETLTRVVVHGGQTYLMFPYIDALGSAPKFDSVSSVIPGPAATVQDFLELSTLVAKAGEKARWAISFNTPWLVPVGEIAGDRWQRSRDRATLT